MRPPPPSRIGKNHRRGVSTTLALVDEALCEFEHWAEGREARSVLYREHNNLSPAQRKSLLAEVSKMRAVIGELRDALGLEAAGQEAAQSIWGRCSALREHLVELTGRHLRRYGKPAPGLADYLDPRVDELLRRLDRVSSLVSGNVPEAPTDARLT
jgi:hypothetical protein